MRRFIVAAIASLGIVGVLSFASSAQTYAVDLFKGCEGNSSDPTCAKANQGKSTDAGAKLLVGNIIKVLMYVIGALSVIMLVYAGFKYTASSGDTQAVQSAKNIILYAVIGIVVALLGYSIVQYIVSTIAK